MRPVFLLFLGVFLSTTTLSSAHAFLDTSEPAVGSTMKASPAVVKIWFTRQLAKAGSNIAVFDAKGTEMDNKDFKVPKGINVKFFQPAGYAFGAFKSELRNGPPQQHGGTPAWPVRGGRAQTSRQ